MARALYLTREERRLRMDTMCEMFKAGKHPKKIAADLGLSSEYVQRVLRKAGFDTSGGKPQRSSAAEAWASADTLRRAIIQRAARGASEALKSIGAK